MVKADPLGSSIVKMENLEENTSRKRMLNEGDHQTALKKKPPDKTINPIFEKFWETEIFQRYLTIKTKEETDDLTGISPFKLGKVLGIHGKIQNIKKQKNKTINIEVSNKKTSEKLLKLKEIFNIPVEITPHRSLNYSKGVIKSHELKGTTEKEMIEELKEQGVTEAKNIKIKKKIKIQL